MAGARGTGLGQFPRPACPIPLRTCTWCGLAAERLGHARSKRSTRCPIPARAFVIRFPNGDFEYDLSRRALPLVGDTMRKRGLLWSVTKITPKGRAPDVATVHVQRVDEPET